MSVQFGRWNLEGGPVAPDLIERAERLLAPYGPDRGGFYIKDSVGILYRAFYTTKESRTETQPYLASTGWVFTWDGRLDNREELVEELREALTTSAPDVAIVAAAYEAWGTRCFSKLMGDWALSLWNPRNRCLLLAKDPIGTRHLYYSFDRDQVTWSTLLDPLILLAGRAFALDEEYIAGWFSFFPATHLTPYVGIHSVSPSSFVLVERGRPTTVRYWDFDPATKVRYHTDAEYEEHFRTVFAQAVRRRLRSNAPILAELSGGMDSSSIVCMAHTIIAGSGDNPRLDTLSYYNDSEPNWNERPYFTKVEETLGRVGCHIDVSALESCKPDSNGDHFAVTPGSCIRPNETSRQFAASLGRQGNRAVLSGIGGDEVTGGVPTPTPELMDALARARFQMLAHELKVWALDKRKPWFYLLFEAARGFCPPSLVDVPKQLRPPPWLYPSFIARHRAALTGYPSRVRLLGPLPSFQENVSTLEVLRRQLACQTLSCTPPHERRYPYLDRDLLEFLFAVPREQIVRPGQRRSLMRRALRGIVPDEILNRRRKAYVAHSSLMRVFSEWTSLIEKRRQMLSASLGIVDSEAFGDAVQKARRGQEVHIVAMMRTLAIESWLRNIVGRVIALPGGSTISGGCAKFDNGVSSWREVSASKV